MKKLITTILILYTNLIFSSQAKITKDLEKKLNTISFQETSITSFKKRYTEEEKKENYLIAYQIAEIKYNPITTKFSGSPVSSNFSLNDRIKMVTTFLNDQVVPSSSLNKNFSFFVSLADSTILPEKFLNSFDLSKVPYVVFDLDKKTYNRDKNLVLLMPDLYLIKNKYEKQRIKINKTTKRWPYIIKKDQAIWRGAQTGGTYNLETKEDYPRGKLVWLSNKNPDYLDAKFVSYDIQTENSESGKKYKELMKKTFGENPNDYFMPFHKMTSYKYNVSLDGNVSAWQRVPWILGSGTVLLYHTDYVQFFTPYLKENEHYISIKPDMSDFKEKVDYLRKNSVKAREITKNAAKLQNEILTREFIIKYYTKAIQGIHDKFQS